MKLIDIFKELVNEGVKVTFDPTTLSSPDPTVDSIAISVSPIEGEQLKTVNELRKTNFYNVYYSLRSDPSSKVPNVKKSEDALKYYPEKINQNELKNLILKTLKSQLPKVDYIGFLESSAPLNNLLLDTIKNIYGVSDDKIIDISKIRYEKIDDAVDWERFRRESSSIKKAITQFLYKTAETEPPYAVKKTGTTPTKIIQRLHSKYDIGLHPNLPNQSLPPIYDVFVKCITQGKTLLIIDDNVHSGTDFKKIFERVDEIINKLREESSKPSKSEQEVFDKIKELEQNPKLKTSPTLQSQYEQAKKIRALYLNRTYTITKDFDKTRNRISGYVLYRLDDRDLKKDPEYLQTDS
jgi:hypothetical protein